MTGFSENRFIADVAAEKIQFRLRADRHNWTMPDTLGCDLPESAKQLYRKDGKVVQNSVFAPECRCSRDLFVRDSLAVYQTLGRALAGSCAHSE